MVLYGASPDAPRLENLGVDGLDERRRMFHDRQFQVEG